MPNITANMGLKIPITGETDYPASMSDSLNSIDTHDHTSGKGVPVALGGIAAGAVNAAALAANSVITAKILDANVTRAKLVAVGQQVSASSGVFTTTNSSATDVTNLSVTITTTGRPVFVGLIHDGTVTAGQYSCLKASAPGGGGVDNRAVFLLVRDATIIAQSSLKNTTVGSDELDTEVPVSALSILDVVAAGTYTYKAQTFSINPPGLGASVQYAKLVAYEL